MRRTTIMKGKSVRGLLACIVLAVIVLILTRGTYAIEGDAALGKTLYKKECVICHGTNGKGDGPAAQFLYPKPRDFTKGSFKIRSTLTLPTDEDLFQTISEGIAGTLMPAFKYLSKEERWALVAYVKSFSEKLKEIESLKPIEVPDPPPQTQELLTQGKQFYEDAGCFNCHGSTGKGDGPSAATLKDEWGNPIVPYDFTIPGKMKGGSTVKDIYRTLVVGIGGTPMPAYGPVLTEEEIWAIAYYTLSLAQPEDQPQFQGDATQGRDLVRGVTRFKNGGPPCMGCHSVMGARAFGGGPWGPDLTLAYQKFKEDGLVTFLETIPFPTMGPLFRPRPLTEEERGHLLAFLRSTQPTGVQAVTARVSPLYTPTILIGVLGVISLTLTGLIAGKKKVEVR